MCVPAAAVCVCCERLLYHAGASFHVQLSTHAALTLLEAQQCVLSRDENDSRRGAAACTFSMRRSNSLSALAGGGTGGEGAESGSLGGSRRAPPRPRLRPGPLSSAVGGAPMPTLPASRSHSVDGDGDVGLPGSPNRFPVTSPLSWSPCRYVRTVCCSVCLFVETALARSVGGRRQITPPDRYTPGKSPIIACADCGGRLPTQPSFPANRRI